MLYIQNRRLPNYVIIFKKSNSFFHRISLLSTIIWGSGWVTLHDIESTGSLKCVHLKKLTLSFLPFKFIRQIKILGIARFVRRVILIFKSHLKHYS